jgi:hypothetical protein
MEVEGADKHDTDMVLSRGAVISGHVEWDTTSGRIPTARDGIIVRMPMEDGSGFGDSVSGYVGTNDQWLINGIMAGRHYFRVDGLPEGWHFKRVEYQGADITDVPWNFDYQQIASGFKIVVSDRTTIVRGFVTGHDGDDLRSYAVVVFSTSPLHWFPQSRYTRLTYPDAKGRYEIRGLPPGNYIAAATREVDRSDLGNPRAFDRLMAQPGLGVPFPLRESQVARQDVTPLVRSSRTSRWP